MDKNIEYALGVMWGYYKYQMDHNTGLKKEYYRGKLEATDLIQRHIVLSDKVQIDYYEQFLRNKGIIKDCNNCLYNPMVNKNLISVACFRECYEPDYKEWEFKQPED